MNKKEIQNKIEELEKQLTELKEELDKPVNKVWKPKLGDTYYCISVNGEVYKLTWADSKYDEQIWAIGNCFRTREEAEFEAEKRKVIAELKRFAEEYNEPIDWNNHNQHKFYFRYNLLSHKIATYLDTTAIGNDIYLSSEKLVRQAVEQIGEKRIKKYYFGVE